MPILKTLQQHKLLFDTHIWIWVLTGTHKMKAEFLKTLENRAENEFGNIIISAISIWEIGMLVEKKRIELSKDTLEWVEEAINSPGIELVPLSPNIAIQSCRLPGEIHGDPADRILIATAHENQAVLVTHDENIIKYGKDRWITVYDPILSR